MRRIFLLLTLFFCFATVFAQRDRNYVYILDCTQSMNGYNGSPKVWDSALDYLKKSIDSLPSTTSVTIIPFQTSVHPAVSFLRSDYTPKQWGNIDATLNSILSGPLSSTNICDAWATSERFIDPHKDNYIILLTDGEDNVKGVSALVCLLQNWCGKYRNTEGFYVKLTESAVNNDLKRVIDGCLHLTDVDAIEGIIPFGKFLKSELSVNTLKLPTSIKIPFSTMGTYEAWIENNNSPLDIQVKNGKIEDGAIVLTISSPYSSIQELNQALGSPKVESSFMVNVDGTKLKISNNHFRMTIVNKEERILVLSNATENQVALKTASYYPAWLFWPESKTDTISYDLGAEMSRQAKMDNSSVLFKVVDDDHNKDFTVLLNGKPVKDNTFVLDKGTNQAVLSFVFHKEAKTGKRYFEIQRLQHHELDRINDEKPEVFDFTLKTGYDVQWNPLKKIFIVLLVLLIAGALLWFLILKRVFYPIIKSGSIIITGPEQYYVKKRLKGARKVVLTSKRQSQGILSRVFKGEVRYVQASYFNPDITITAARKKSVRFTSVNTKQSGWDFYPSSTLKRGDAGTLTNRATNDISQIVIQ